MPFVTRLCAFTYKCDKFVRIADYALFTRIRLRHQRRFRMSQYIHVGIVLITVPNLIVIGLMIVVFALAVALALPQHPE